MAYTSHMEDPTGSGVRWEVPDNLGREPGEKAPQAPSYSLVPEAKKAAAAPKPEVKPAVTPIPKPEAVVKAEQSDKDQGA